IRRGEEPDGEARVIRSAASDSELFSAVLSNGRTITFREITAGDLLYLEKSLGNLGDMERSLKLASRISTGEGRWSYEDLQRLKMRDLRAVTDLLAKAGDNEDDEDEFPNES
ncbi:MAG: phage tail assembly protein, partial [Euryarchaeota archaeon]|nr:phage tail assembly protein [Euryarchaeota archaeon]